MRIKFITLNAINIEVAIAQKNMQLKKKVKYMYKKIR
jgi:hypothetical protein